MWFVYAPKEFLGELNSALLVKAPDVIEQRKVSGEKCPELFPSDTRSSAALVLPVSGGTVKHQMSNSPWARFLVQKGSPTSLGCMRFSKSRSQSRRVSWFILAAAAATVGSSSNGSSISSPKSPGTFRTCETLPRCIMHTIGLLRTCYVQGHSRLSLQQRSNSCPTDSIQTV
jgi:hypothetical protein